MIRQNIVNLYAHGSGVDLMVAEKDVVLTYALKALEGEGYPGLVFKGGTCLRKCYFGRITRFSEDLDFQGERRSGIREKALKIFDKREFHGIRFSVSGVYETSESIGMDVTYSHEWNPGSAFKLQISLRGDCILPSRSIQVKEEPYAKYLEFSLPVVPCMALEEIIAEKIRALYQRATARDGFDLFLFSKRPFDEELVRRLVVLKMWDAHQDFDPERLTGALSRKNWYDLERLIRSEIRPEEVIEGISARFSFLMDMDEEDRELLKDSRKHAQAAKRKEMESFVRALCAHTAL